MSLTINRGSLCRGFTLIEMAVVLVIIGLLIGIGSSMIGPLTKRAKLMETRETVKTAYEAVMGYAAQNKRLPTTTQFTQLGVKTSDSYGNPLNYYIWTGTDLCTSTGTYLTVNDASNGTAITKDKVAFILIANGENRCNQTGAASPFYIYQQGDSGAVSYPGFPSVPACPAGGDYDDIVMYADIDTIRGQICQPFTITTWSLPMGTVNQPYQNVTLTAANGTPPFTWTCPVLPAGLRLDQKTGVISGTPTQPGSYPVTIGNSISHVSSRQPTNIDMLQRHCQLQSILPVVVGGPTSCSDCGPNYYDNYGQCNKNCRFSCLQSSCGSINCWQCIF
ncbi:MAG: putative Ig domain-containing protein [Dissulfurimicrobium hydrothermale]|uniref:putative Ig domain-containing protein n=1 Tax=Dissulfurimicrobium hydrothermale TaxID=1750598 RepID=UPI003C718591